MHVWREVLWSSFTDELTKIANVNAGAKAMRMARPRPQANMLKNIKPTNPNPATGFNSIYSTKPNMVQPVQLPARPSSTMQAPSIQAAGASPVPMRTNVSNQLRPVPSMPTNMPNPLTSGNIPPLQSSGPMNMMNIGKY